jgi:hypothetical protein
MNRAQGIGSVEEARDFRHSPGDGTDKNGAMGYGFIAWNGNIAEQRLGRPE